MKSLVPNREVGTWVGMTTGSNRTKNNSRNKLAGMLYNEQSAQLFDVPQ